MADFAVHGKKGTGKSKFAVYVLQQALGNGRRVAANFPVNLDKLLPQYHKVAFTQVPNRPTRRDLEALGHGNPDSYDEEKNGVLILDELAVWLNSRNFQDKSREEIIDWAVHARKWGWDTYWLCQNPMQIDRQVRESLLEYSVSMRKLEKVRLPGIGFLLQLVGLRGTFPRGMHSAVIKLGFADDAPLVERVIFKGKDLHDAYDTRYIFVHDPEQVSVTWLGPRYFVPRPAPLTWREKAAAALGLFGAGKGRMDRASLHHWPQSVMRLPPETRWHLARSLASRSDWAGVQRDPAKAVCLEASNRPTFANTVGAKAAAG